MFLVEQSPWIPVSMSHTNGSLEKAASMWHSRHPPFLPLDNFLTSASPDEVSLAWDLPKGVLVVVLELRGKNTTFLSLSSHETENINFSLFLSLLSHYTQLIGVEG